MSMNIFLLSLALFAMLGQTSWANAEKHILQDVERIQNETEILKQEQEKILQELSDTKKEFPPVLKSPFANSEFLSDDVLQKCAIDMQNSKKILEQNSYSRESWLHHIFECDTCCAPLLDNIMEVHIKHVEENPSVVILFNFETYVLTEKYRQQLRTLMRQFDKTHDRILLVGRASKLGSRSYNIELSGKRAGEIKDYLSTHFAVNESRIHHLFFGYDPPQLTPAIATRYGVTKADIDAIDTHMQNPVANKINQSVVVIRYREKPPAQQVATPTQPDRKPVEKPVEKTKRKLKLAGTVAGGSNGYYAIIEDSKNRPIQSLYRVGDTIQDTIITEIHADCVVMGQNGQYESLCFSR